jgi:hypothetical protein
MQSLQRKVNADSTEVKGEEAPKGGLQRKVNADSTEVKGLSHSQGNMASNMYLNIHLHDTLHHDICIHKHSLRHT